MARTIFLLIGEKPEGPYTLEEVQALVHEGTVPTTMLSWKEGEAEWSPIGPRLAETAGDVASPDGTEPEAHPMFEPAEALREAREVVAEAATVEPAGGFRFNLNRAQYGGLVFVTQLVSNVLQLQLAGSPALVLALMALFTVVALALAAMRFRDMDMSGWKSLWLIVPFANLYYGLLCISAPTGYGATRTYDTAGKVIVGLVLLLVLGLGVLLVIGAGLS